jgi:hypothetical protein
VLGWPATDTYAFPHGKPMHFCPMDAMVTAWNKTCFCVAPSAFLSDLRKREQSRAVCSAASDPEYPRRRPLLCSSIESGNHDSRGDVEYTDGLPWMDCGTTSLLLRIDAAGLADLQTFTERWLRSHVSAFGPLPVPVSVEGGRLLFYGSDGGVRGELRIETLQSLDGRPSSFETRVSSASRFLNRGGSSNVSLPGERGIVRALFRAVVAEFGERSVYVLYKSPHIRLGAQGRGSSESSASGGSGPDIAVVMAVRVRGRDANRVSGFVERWDGGLFSGGGPFFMGDGIMRDVLPNGKVVIRCGGNGGEVVLRVKQRASGPAAFAAKTRGDAGWDDVVVTASTSTPREPAVRRVLRRLAADLQTCFEDCRVHYPR